MCPSTGSVRFVWDNSYSYFTSKKLNYSVQKDVITKEEIEELDEDQHQHELEDEKHDATHKTETPSATSNSATV